MPNVHFTDDTKPAGSGKITMPQRNSVVNAIWRYIDADGCQCGPFETIVMRELFNSDVFDENTMISCDRYYVSLVSIFPNVSDAFLSDEDKPRFVNTDVVALESDDLAAFLEGNWTNLLGERVVFNANGMTKSCAPTKMYSGKYAVYTSDDVMRFQFTNPLPGLPSLLCVRLYIELLPDDYTPNLRYVLYPVVNNNNKYLYARGRNVQNDDGTWGPLVFARQGSVIS